MEMTPKRPVAVFEGDGRADAALAVPAGRSAALAALPASADFMVLQTYRLATFLTLAMMDDPAMLALWFA